MDLGVPELLQATDHTAARWLLERGIALIYVLAFVNVLHQWRPLLGDGGLTPARERLTVLPRPVTWLRWGYDDRLVTTIAVGGLGLALLLVAGVPQRGSWWLATTSWLLLWSLYLSLVEVGRTWYGFGWETLLLEAGVLAAFLGPADAAPPWLTLLLLRWLLFRVEFGAGLIKLRGDPCWRRLTCLDHHHETQPLPGPLSRWFHRLPRPVHRLEVASNHLAQLVAPFGLFLPQPIAGTSALLIIVSQGWLLLSGNFAWLNLLTIVLATAALPDAWLGLLIEYLPAGANAGTPLGAEAVAPTPTSLTVFTVGFAGLVLWLSVRGPIPNLLSPRQRMNASHDRLRLVNSYGAFGSVTEVRHELEFEATLDDPDDPDARWEPYGFPAKPDDPARRPRQVAPYHLRLDWLLWFAAMDPMPTRQRWFTALLDGLLAADPSLLRLLDHAPFGLEPPAAIRVVRYRYRFADRTHRRRTGETWIRDQRQVLVAPVSAPPEG